MLNFPVTWFFEKSSKLLPSCGAAQWGQVCAPAPLPPSAQLKVSLAQTDLNPGFSEWKALSNNFSPYFHQITATHLGQVISTFQSCKTRQFLSVRQEFLSHLSSYFMAKSISSYIFNIWHKKRSSRLILNISHWTFFSLISVQQILFLYHSVIQKFFPEPNLIF
jgi:hypothetical protein